MLLTGLVYYFKELAKAYHKAADKLNFVAAHNAAVALAWALPDLVAAA